MEKSHVKRVFVTVGTTDFKKLIDAITEDNILELLNELGYKYLLMQTGGEVSTEKHNPNVKLSYVPYLEDFIAHVDKSDLIVSHAGAGSCLEVLKRNKPLIVVVNEDLMDNHQLELAEHLERIGYAYCANVRALLQILKRDIQQLKNYPVHDKNLFPRYLDACMGFAE